MNRINQLIAQYCPDGVAFKKLGDIAELVRGNGMPRIDFSDAGVGCIHYGQIYTYYGTYATETISFVPAEKAAKLAKVDPGDIIITNTSENLEDVCKAVAWLGDAQIVTGGHATVVKHRQDPKFLAYWFQSLEFHKKKKKFATGTKVMDVSAKSLARIEIPLPPLAVQREIASILDKMERLEHELKAEQELRRRQYAHYRDQLLSFPEASGAQWVPMGELGTFIRGRRFTKNDVVDVGIPSMHYGEIYTDYGIAANHALSYVREGLRSSLRFAKHGDVVIACVGETVEDVAKAVAWLGNDEVAIHDDCFAFRHDLNPKFVSYYMQTAKFNGEKMRHVARAKVKRISAVGLSKIVIPVPERAEQERIVGILDHFDALLNDVIPVELAARRKQFEYYREFLLTFHGKVAG